MNKQTHCVDCGLLMDNFGACPQAEPDAVRLKRAPVNCGKTTELAMKQMSAALPNGVDLRAAS